MENLGKRSCLHNGLYLGLFIKVGLLSGSRFAGEAPWRQGTLALPLGRIIDKGRIRFRFQGSTTVLLAALDNMTRIHGKLHPMVAVLDYPVALTLVASPFSPPVGLRCL